MPVPESAGDGLREKVSQKEPYANSMKKLHGVLRRLQTYEEDYRLDPGRISEKAFTALQSYFSLTSPVLPTNALIGVYGSIIYHDPVDLDADIVVILPTLLAKQRRRSFVGMQAMLHNLRSSWPVIPFHADVFLANMEEIKQQAPVYEQNNAPFDIANQAAHVLAARLLFDDMADLVKHSLYQGEIFALTRKYPVFRKGVISYLSDVAEIRRKRRLSLRRKAK